MRKYFVLIIIPFLFLACKKKSTIHITAKNAVTGKPYPGLEYAIVRSRTGVFENHYKTEASGTLNENGEAYITKFFSKNWSHEIQLETPSNVCYGGSSDIYFSGGENVESNFEFAECGYLKIESHNVNCQGASDTFYPNRWRKNIS